MPLTHSQVVPAGLYLHPDASLETAKLLCDHIMVVTSVKTRSGPDGEEAAASVV